jgi:ABC-type uncharacterized transport system auxiliary subunit
MKTVVTLSLAALMLFSGCITVSVPLGGGDAEPSFKWRLRWDAPRETGDVVFSCALRIKDLDASGSYQLSGMVIKRGDGSVTESSSNRWAARPGSMLSELLSRDLLLSGNYPAVFRTAVSVNNLLSLEGYVREFGATQVDSVTWIAVLDVDITLFANRGNEIILQKNYRYERRMPEPGFKPLSDQMSVLGSQWSEAVMNDLATALSHR